MTLDEAIKHIEKVAKENQRIADTGILFDNVTIDMLYCDDTEVIEEHLANYQKCAERHKQFAEWLKDYKRLLEQKPCDDAISRHSAIFLASDLKQDLPDDERIVDMVIAYNQGILEYQTQLSLLPPVNPQPKIGYWIQTEEKDDAEPFILWECSECHKEFRSVIHKVSNYCPNCGVKMLNEEK